jgi:hypothetical protein
MKMAIAAFQFLAVLPFFWGWGEGMTSVLHLFTLSRVLISSEEEEENWGGGGQLQGWGGRTSACFGPGTLAGSRVFLVAVFTYPSWIRLTLSLSLSPHG